MGQVTAKLNVSKRNVDTGEKIYFTYTSNASDNFPYNSVFLDVIHADGTVLWEVALDQANSQSGISYRVSSIRSATALLQARIVDKSDRDALRILSTVSIHVTRRIYEPVPVTSGGVTMSLRTVPFCDCSQIIDFSRVGGVESGDYIEFHSKGSRQNWHWCQDRRYIDFGYQVSERDELVTIKYFVNGGTFHAGTLTAEMMYTLRNPIEEFSVSASSLEIQDNVAVRYKVSNISPNGLIVGKFEGSRIFSWALLTLEGECVIPCPRFPGAFEIAYVAGEKVLVSKTITVTDRLNRAQFSIDFRGYAPDHQILTVHSGQRFEVQASGQLLNAMDCVAVVKSHDLFIKPSNALLQLPHQEKPLGSTGVCSFQLEAEGIYHLCLALSHDRVKLLGAWCSVIVSDRVGNTIHPHLPEPIDARPVLPSPPLVIVPDNPTPLVSGFICCICLDKTVTMKFDPCKHVCTCDTCCQYIASGGVKECPVCKKPITSWEKVFIV